MKYNMMLLADFYKLSHRIMYPEGTETVYSTWTPRTSRVDGVTEVVSAGHQAFIKKRLINMFNEQFFSIPKEEVLPSYVRIIKNTLGIENPDTKHIEDLHDLGYLPLKIKAVREGTLVPLRVPMLTIENTDPRFFWLTNYIETLASCELWQASTSATLAFQYRKILNSYAMETVGNTDFVSFQGHDFSMRGMGGLEAAMMSGSGHLLSFAGTDTVPAINYLEEYYNADVEKELVGTSVPATEHSVQCAFGNDDKYVKDVITRAYPSGIVSVVSDGYDFWDVIDRVIPSLKADILARDGKVVIRPDSGDPVKIVCGDEDAPVGTSVHKGAIEALWDTFGGTVTDTGYKLLDSHIGLIYGDAITLERATAICEGLKKKGFASINVVFGIGSFTYQYNTRDTFGFALKSTLCKIGGEEIQIFKDPKTDDGTKKSLKGKVVVYKENGNIKVQDGNFLNYTIGDDDLLEPVFENGKLLVDDNLSAIRSRLASNL